MSERSPLTLPADQVQITDDGIIITMPGSLTRNAAQCLACGNTIESIHRHDYRMCGCPNGTMVDGGLAYQRWGAVDPSQIRDLSEHGPPSVLVALNQPCPTCVAYCAERDLEFDRVIDCADCGSSGRLVFDLKTPCDVLAFEGPDIHNHPDVNPCPRCDGTGTVTRRVRLDPEMGVLPIIDKPSDSHGKPAIAGPCTSDTGERVGFVMPHGSIDPTRGGYLGALPSAAEVGWYVARAVEVRT